MHRGLLYGLKWWLSCFVIVVAAGVVCLLRSDTSYAVYGWNSGRNDMEKQAWGGDPCGDLIYHPCAVWWASYHNTDYFSIVGSTSTNPIEIEWNAKAMYFTIRGSWNTQRFRNPIRIYSLFTFSGQGRSVWVTNPAGHIDGNGHYYFNRGIYGGGGPEYQWINGESEKDQLDLGADVDGVGQPGGRSELVTLRAKSCLAVMRSNIVYTYSGSSINCGTDNIRLWVRRKARPSGWSVKGESYVYSRSDNKTYANYNNSNAFGSSRPYAERHPDGKPNVFPGGQAEFVATLRNAPYSNYQHISSSVQVTIESAYFKNLHDVASCAGKDWRYCGGSDNGHKVLITRGAVSNIYSDKCRSALNNLVQSPNNTNTWSGRDGDECMKIRVPSDGSRAGSYICTQIWWSWPNLAAGKGWGSSEPACARVASDFNLVPGVGPAGGSTSVGVLEQGNAAMLDSTIYNTGGRREAGGSSTGEVFTFAFTGSAAEMSDSQLNSTLSGIFTRNKGDRYYIDTMYAPNINVCSWLNSLPQLSGKVSDCTPTNSRRSAFDTTEVIDTSALDTARYKIGDVICRVAAVNRYNWHTTDRFFMHRISYPRCYRISKRPMVQVWGGDVRVGSSNVANALITQQYKSGIYTGGARTLTMGGNPHSIGSWGEYGMFAPEISSYSRSNVVSASGGALSGMGTTSRLGVAAESELNGLTFANSKSRYGQWGAIGAQNTVKASYFGTQRPLAGENISLNSLDGSYKLSSSRSIVNLSGGTIGVGKSVIIDAGDKTLVIDGDIRYDANNFSSASQLPQVVIYARNIIVKDNVTNVDAWLIASGTSGGTGGVVSTCEVDESGIRAALTRSDYTSGLNSTVCDKPLQINGIVSARVLQLRRTHGADGSAGNENGYTVPAEIINSRMDTYLWAYSKASANSSISTDATTELPPRY